MVQEWKKDKVKEVKEDLKKYAVVAIVDMAGLPTKQLQGIKKEVGKKMNLKMTKKSILLKALEGTKYESLKNTLGRMPALLFTNDNPFTLYKTLKRSMVPSFAKAGNKLPAEVIIPAGGTDFPAGPMIGEFGKFKIKTKVEAGKITILKDTKIADKDDNVTSEMASFLQKMNVKPMLIGLTLLIAQEDNTLYTADVLDIDEELFMNKLLSAAQHALNLSVEAGIITKDNVEILISKAYNHAKNLAMDADIITKDLISEQLSKAERQAMSLKKEVE